jgi:hypothetical protein
LIDQVIVVVVLALLVVALVALETARDDHRSISSRDDRDS